jgi:hypothetical protein
MLQIPAELNGYKLRASCSYEGGSGVIFGYKANSACRSGFSFVVASVNADCLEFGQWMQGHYFEDEEPAIDCYFELADREARWANMYRVEAIS